MPVRPFRPALLIATTAFAVVASACSGSSDTATTTTAARATTTTVARPEGPAADVSKELSGGSGVFMGAAVGAKVPAGFEEHEYLATGTAQDYRFDGTPTKDGRWKFVPNRSAEYRTRVVVRYPSDAAKFSGTAVVEWLNVSGGLDANPEYASFEDEIVRKGHVWVGVSVQRIGVEGGPVLVKTPGFDNITGKGLKKLDPERYGTLDHPGDGFSYDIFTQVARAVRSGAATGGAKPSVVLAAGESQSAIALTTYYDGVQPLTLEFDGFFVHSRASVALPLVEPGQSADLAGSITNNVPAIIRTDLDAPVMELQAETDVTGVLKSIDVRQPDTDRFRLWEVAGTAHADAHLLGEVAKTIDCGAPVNNGPMHVVAKAALRALDTWVRSGTAPARAQLLTLEIKASPPALARNSDGIALGGVRTAPLDAPVDVLSGVPGPNDGILCLLLGSTKPLSAERIAALYSSRDDYVQAYTRSVDSSIAAGFVLADDRATLMAFSDPQRVGR